MGCSMSFCHCDNAKMISETRCRRILALSAVPKQFCFIAVGSIAAMLGTRRHSHSRGSRVAHFFCVLTSFSVRLRHPALTQGVAIVNEQLIHPYFSNCNVPSCILLRQDFLVLQH